MKINAFFRKNNIDPFPGDPDQPESVRKLIQLNVALAEQYKRVHDALIEGRFLVGSPDTGKAWDEALRHHLTEFEPNRQQAAILYGGMISRRCNKVADYLGSEFPASDLLAEFEGSVDYFLGQEKEDYVLQAEINVSFGEYDFDRRAFPVTGIVPANDASDITFKHEAVGVDLRVWKEDRYRCQFNDPNLEKDGLRAPKEINLSRSLLLSRAVQAIRSPIAMSPEQAERLIEDYQKAGIRTRSLLAIAYFSKPDWQSNGVLVDGKVSINGTAKLLHIEYYAYPHKPGSGHGGNAYFNVGHLSHRKAQQLGGEFVSDDFMRILGRSEHVPIQPPVASVSFQ